MLGTTCNSFLEFAAHHFLTVAALTALFLPLFGPLMDHHFAERQPGHAHIYLSNPAHNHLHSYETDDHHSIHSPNVADADAQPANVVALTDTHGIGSGPSGTPAYLQQPTSAIFHHEGDANRFAYIHENSLLRDAAIPAPKRPPRM